MSNMYSLGLVHISELARAHGLDPLDCMDIKVLTHSHDRVDMSLGNQNLRIDFSAYAVNPRPGLVRDQVIYITVARGKS